MQPTGKRQFVIKKAYEVSYAIFRISSRLSNTALKEHLERQALSLLDAAAVDNYAWVGTVLRALQYLVKFGSDIGLVHETNTETIMTQLDAINVAIAGLDKAASPEEVPLEDIFSDHEQLFPESVIPAKSRKEMNPEDAISASFKSGNRQSAIVERIRQSGNCRLKDILEILPNTSERTIRYDLQSLVEQNIVERVGNGGPSVFYRIRQGVHEGNL